MRRRLVLLVTRLDSSFLGGMGSSGGHCNICVHCQVVPFVLGPYLPDHWDWVMGR